MYYLARILGPVTLALTFCSQCEAIGPIPTFRADFAEVDITPPKGTPRQGWNSKLVGESALDPFYTRAAVFEKGEGGPLVVIQIDVALVSAVDTATIRRLIEDRHGIPSGRIMVARLRESDREPTGTSHPRRNPDHPLLASRKFDLMGWPRTLARSACAYARSRIQSATAAVGVGRWSSLAASRRNDCNSSRLAFGFVFIHSTPLS
ncbi:MAG: Neutral ceramidase [Planctomycetota bacterium]|nr:Neutral ceramidase [Planctomycetota bacterium]